ncbi:MAG: iron-containing redox enzyme family protein [Actinomycetota bacterium]|nr:iron-containing redox enzyme family protein [Actinomycetota bacterium]
MRLPTSRGPLSAAVMDVLHKPWPHARSFPPVSSTDVLRDEDAQIALWTCYELSYRGFDGVDLEWESDPGLVAFRRELERHLLGRLRHLAADRAVESTDVPTALTELIAADDGPPLAGFLQREATVTQFREFVAHRSVYHLKEADPHSWAIPRLVGRAKAALIEIQADEYGGGRVERMHSELFRTTMRELGLDDTYGHYVDAVPAVTLAISNAMSFFGLHRRWTGALIGHLAAFEMTSSLPNRRYGNGLRRLGFGETATHFYDEHVEADAVHEQIAAHDLCGSYAKDNPEAVGDILFGAACALALDAEFGRHLLDHWERNLSALGRVTVTAA